MLELSFFVCKVRERPRIGLSGALHIVAVPKVHRDSKDEENWSVGHEK